MGQVRETKNSHFIFHPLIQIKILRQDDQLLAVFVTKRPARIYLLDFVVEDSENYRIVNTYADHKHIAKDIYPLPNQLDAY